MDESKEFFHSGCDPDFQCDNNQFHNQKYYETTSIDYNKPHPNGKCRFKNCEAPSIVEGFCPFHYNIVCQHESRYMLKNIAYILNDIYRILRHFEYHFFPPPSSSECNCNCCNNSDSVDQSGENNE